MPGTVTGLGPRRVPAALVGAALLLTAACGGGGGNASGAAKANTPDAQVTITPADSTGKVRPERGVVVQATSGTLDAVTVQVGGKEAPGDFNAQRTEWRTKWALTPGAKYAVQATAKSSAGKPTTATSNFKTLTPESTFAVSQDSILEDNRGRAYGIGLPIILNFDREIANKADVEKALEVTAEKPVEGAWRWDGNQQVIYRTKEYWQPHQKVTLTAHLAGVRGAKDVYGTKDFTRTYKIGKSQISQVDFKKHKMTVTVDGVKRPTYGISAGNGQTTEYTTSSGIHMTMEKGSPVQMVSPNRKKGDPGYYDLTVYYAVRITSLGEYLHQTVGEEYCLGRSNCSHGCIRQPSKQAIWFYKNVQPADIVVTKGSNRKLSWNNGWSFWQMSWTAWQKGSALYVPPPPPPTPTPPATGTPAATPTS